LYFGEENIVFSKRTGLKAALQFLSTGHFVLDEKWTRLQCLSNDFYRHNPDDIGLQIADH
jgi:hypothetical protein